MSESGSTLAYRGGGTGASGVRRITATVVVVSLRAFFHRSVNPKTVVARAHLSVRAALVKESRSDEMNLPFAIRRVRNALARPLGFILLALASVSVSGKPATRPPGAPDAGKLFEQTRQPLRWPPPEEPILPKPPEPKPALPASPQLKVKVEQFSFTGNTLYSEAELQPIVQEFIGKELDFEGLNEAATKVRAYYRTRGYFLAQAYLPQQAIRNGRVEIGVIEGRVGEVELDRKPGTRIADSLLVGILGTHLKQGQIITETGLERPLLLINDLPGAQVTSEIRPSKTLGAADLRVNVSQPGKLFNGFVDADNHGNRFTGEYRVGTNLNWDTPLGYGDQATFRGFVSDEGMWYTRFAYLIPIGYRGTRIGVSYSKFESRLAKDFANLNGSGQGEVKSIYAFHSLVRTRNTNVILQVSYEDKTLIDLIESQSSIERREISAAKLGLVGDFRDAFLGGGLNASAFSYTPGAPGIAPPSGLRLDVGRTGPKTFPRCPRYKLDIHPLHPTTDHTS